MSPCSRASIVLSAALALGGLAAGCGSASDAASRQQARVSQPEVRAAVTSSRPTTKPVRDDAEAAESFATPDGVRLTQKAPAPGAAKAAAKKATAKTAAGGKFGETADNFISPGAPSDDQIAEELKQMQAVQKQQAKVGGRGHGIRLNPDGTATVAPDVPAVIARVVAGANAIAKFPYVYGGGHGSFVDTAYDCSGSLSYALAAGGLLDTTKTSGELAKTGKKGPGEWITIYANAGHTFMSVDGLRFDTSGRSGPRGSRWQTAPRSLAGFAVVHPPGL